MSLQLTQSILREFILPILRCQDNSFMSNVRKLLLIFFLSHHNLCPFLALSLEQDIPDYDLDAEDELWLNTESKDPNLTPYRFEQMMDRLEKITVCTLDDAKALVKRNEVSQDVFDYWVSKRLKTVSSTSFYLRIS